MPNPDQAFQLNFDANTVDPSAVFMVQPVGWAVGSIVKTYLKDTNSGTGQFIAFDIELQAPYSGTITERLNVKNPKENTVKMAYATLSAMCRACGRMQIASNRDLLGATLELRIDQDGPSMGPNGNIFGPSNDIKGYRAISGACGFDQTQPNWDNAMAQLQGSQASSQYDSYGGGGGGGGSDFGGDNGGGGFGGAPAGETGFGSVNAGNNANNNHSDNANNNSNANGGGGFDNNSNANSQGNDFNANTGGGFDNSANNGNNGGANNSTNNNGGANNNANNGANNGGGNNNGSNNGANNNANNGPNNGTNNGGNDGSSNGNSDAPAWA